MTEPNDQLASSELRKIESEIARNKAEAKKLLTETNEIKKVLSIKSSIKAIIGGIVAAGLLAAWFISYMQPILEKENKLSEIDNKILSLENDLQKMLNENEKQKLDSLIISSTKIQRLLKVENDSLKSGQMEYKLLNIKLTEKLRQISDDYKKLSIKEDITEGEKKRFSALAAEAIQEAVKLKQELEEYNLKIKSSDKKTLIDWLKYNQWLLEGYKRLNTVTGQFYSSNIDIMFEINGQINGGSFLWQLNNKELMIFSKSERFGNSFTFKANIVDENPSVIEGIVHNGSDEYISKLIRK